jgi:methyltransferase
LAKRNENYILGQGGKIVNEKNYIFMVVLHTSWLIVLLYFSFFKVLNFSLPLFWLSVLTFVFGQFLRITAIKTLGKRWSTRIIILPNEPAINKGVFKWIRHPNYLGVILELASLPLAASLFGISLIFSLLNLIILFFRIRLEEKNLKKYNDYSNLFNLEGKDG